MRTTKELLEEAKERVVHIRHFLPSHIDPVVLSSVKLAFTPLASREALIWRVAELAETACNCFERDAVGAGIVLTRALTECTAATWYLMGVVRDITPDNYRETDDILTKLWLGSRADSNLPKPINILNMLDVADKTCRGIRNAYDSLSEYSHPNWAAQSLNRNINYESKIIHFGHFPGNADSVGLHCLIAALVAFEHAYNEISDLMPNFIATCELAASPIAD